MFDLDGTLVDSVETRIAAWLETFVHERIPATRDQLAPLIGVDGRRLAREIAALAGEVIDDERAEAIDRLSGEIYARRNTSPRPLPGVGAVVEALERHRIRWAIATSSRRDQVAPSVAALGLEREPPIVDASHVAHAKPEPDLLFEAARVLEVEAGHCWCVGDSTWDMVAAVAAGMVPVAVTAGSAVSAEGLAAAGAVLVVRTLDGVAEAIRAAAGGGAEPA